MAIVPAKADTRRRDEAQRVRRWTVKELHDLLKKEGIERAFIVFENGEFTLSHQVLRPIRSFFELSQDFACHEGVFIGREDGLETLFLAFVHDTRRGLSQGGLRFKPYNSAAELFVDGLRLGRGMTRKNALAGLWWGGGKGIMPVTPAIAHAARRGQLDEQSAVLRRRLFEAYGRFVASLGGIYYTAEDIGTTTRDMEAILSQNRFTTCIPASFGGSGNPSPYTAQGVFRAMQAGWSFITGRADMTDVRVAVQGAGNVGAPLIQKLVNSGAKVWVCDINQGLLDAIKTSCPTVTITPPETIFDLPVDVFAPCAIGAQVNKQTIPRLKVKLICGAANNILKEPDDAELLRLREIIFVPDYLCNRMGIVNCADEWYGYLEDDVRITAERVFPDTLRVLKHARTLGIPTTRAADDLADAAASVLHPLIGHRGRRIIDHLIRNHKNKRARSRTAELNFDFPLDEPAVQDQWEKQGVFKGASTVLAAMPISTATGPQLGSFLSALLLDVHARYLTQSKGQRPRRILGSDHGGRALQLLIEQSLPHERVQYPRPEFIKRCSDYHQENDARIRQQLRSLGIGFDPDCWLDPMSRRGHEIVRQLYHNLLDAGLVKRETRLVHHCPSCQTSLVNSDIQRSGQVSRCGRCGSLTEIRSSQELFVHLESARGHLENALRSGAITFSQESWRDSFVKKLQKLEPWCISRQQWWGHEISDSPGEVFSTWFSMVAWTFVGTGWPGQAQPSPISEVFVDPDWLIRWVLPSQLLSFMVTGRPAFTKIHVHGSLDLIERSLREHDEDQPFDEDRFLYRTLRRPMRRSHGNVVEPKTLIRRYGADALRLGTLLCLKDADSRTLTVAESNLRRARRAIHRLNAMVSGLPTKAFDKIESIDKDLADVWLLAALQDCGQEAESALEARRYDVSADQFIESIRILGRYLRLKSQDVNSGSTLGIINQALALLKHYFQPLCPFILEKLVPQEAALERSSRRWLATLLRAIKNQHPSNKSARICVSDSEAFSFLERNKEHLESLAQCHVSIDEGANESDGEDFGPCRLLR
jgi:leucine dehydrogenase